MGNFSKNIFKRVISKIIHPNSTSEELNQSASSSGPYRGVSAPEANMYGPRYSIANDRSLVNDVFDSFRQRIFDVVEQRRELEQNGSLSFKVHMEFGKIGQNRPYFYIRPFNHLGWLFERQGVGWVVSLADKVDVKDLFIRKGDVWDIVSVLESEENKGLVRVSSQRLSSENLPLTVYVDRLISKIGLDNSNREY